MARMAFGVYVHIPFCAHRCDYCDFATWTDRSHLIDDYVDACVADLERRRAVGYPSATSVFFGGGTPSLIAGEQLARILDVIERTPGCEVTVECNPDSVDAHKLGVYARAGVNRLSFGVQSMVPHVLAALGRTHDPANVERAVALARAAGIARLNADLIYGAAGESLDDWRRSLDGVLALGVEHVSAYALTVEPATPLGRGVAAGTRVAPDDDEQADCYVVADEILGAAGFDWYEISNWARPGEGVPAQPPLLGPGRVPRDRLRRARAHRRPALVERAHPGAVHRGGDGGIVGRGRWRGARRPRPGGGGVLARVADEPGRGRAWCRGRGSGGARFAAQLR